jgi:DNA-binding winged helix-turn-helix (wHTH) protein
VWAGQPVKDEALQRQINQVRKKITDLNTPHDTIQGILRRLDDLDWRRPPG